MAFSGLHEFIQLIEKKGELIRVLVKVNTELEITEIVDRISKSEGGGKAILFENCGTKFPLLINSFGSINRMSLALGCENLDEVGQEIEQLFKTLSSPRKNFLEKLKMLPFLSQIASWMPKSVKGRGKCQEVVINDIDLTQLPILKCWPADGGAFVTLPCVVTRDPDTGIRNVGMYRMQVLDKQTTGMHWHKHKTGAKHYTGYKERNQQMPVSVVLGGDPAYTYSATAPLPDNIDEYMLAGFLRKRKVELVKCLTNNIEVPADADIIIEGYVDTTEELVWEGPFGDHTGFYSLADWYPKFHVTCITHRKNAIYPATIVGIPPQEDAYIGLATEKIFLSPMKMTMIPELQDMYLPPAGVAHNLTLSRIEKKYAGQATKVMSAMWGAGQMMFNKILIVTDSEIDIRNIENFAKTVSERVNPARDIIFSRGPMDVLDHSSSRFAFGSKLGIDASCKFDEEKTDEQEKLNRFENFDFSSILNDNILKINPQLLSLGISILIVGIKKSDEKTIENAANRLLKLKICLNIKFIIFVDNELDINNYQDVAWFVTGNIDPYRDCTIIEPTVANETAHLLIDGTRKSLQIDGFKRDWPNPVLSSLETIKLVDNRWNEYGLGEFIPSPSLKYLDLKLGESAVSQ